MLPPIPQKLRKIDDSTVDEHFWLDGNVVQSFIKARYANAEVRGLFLSRCVREPVESAAPQG